MTEGPWPGAGMRSGTTVPHHPPVVWSFLRMEAARLESCPGLGDAWPRPGGAEVPGESPWGETGHSPGVSPCRAPEGRSGDRGAGRWRTEWFGWEGTF